LNVRPLGYDLSKLGNRLRLVNGLAHQTSSCFCYFPGVLFPACAQVMFSVFSSEPHGRRLNRGLRGRFHDKFLAGIFNLHLVKTQRSEVSSSAFSNCTEFCSRKNLFNSPTEVAEPNNEKSQKSNVGGLEQHAYKNGLNNWQCPMI